jgi:hypothetical protein
MPSLNEATQPAPDNYVPVERPTPPIGPASAGNLTPVQNPSMRCPVPQTNFSADAQTQFYRGNTVPQYRTFTPPQLSNQNSGSGTTTSITNVETTSGGTVTEIVQLQTMNVSFTTPVLNPNQSYVFSTSVAHVYLLLHLSTTNSARVRVYATASAQTLDLSRASTQAPAYGTTQGLIADITMDTVPDTWLFTPVAISANGDNPMSTISYVTITNLSSSSIPITVAFTYVPIVH